MKIASYDNTGGKNDRRSLFDVEITGTDLSTPQENWNNIINGDYSTGVVASYGGGANDIYLFPKIKIEFITEFTIFFSQMNSYYTKTLIVEFEDGKSEKVHFKGKSSEAIKVDSKTIYKQKVAFPSEKKDSFIKKITILEGGTYDNYAIQEIEFSLYTEPKNKNFIFHDGFYKKFTPSSQKVDAVYSESKLSFSEASIFSSVSDLSGKVENLLKNNRELDITKLDEKNELTITAIFSKTQNITRYDITNMWGYEDNSSHGSTRNRNIPSNWRIETSDNSTDGLDGDWKIIDTQQNILIKSDGVTKRFNLTKKSFFKAFRIIFFNMTFNSYTKPHIAALNFTQESLVSEEIPFIASKWENISKILPSESVFLSEGMELTVLDRKVQFINPLTLNLSLRDDKSIHSSVFDLEKLINIKEISFQERE